MARGVLVCVFDVESNGWISALGLTLPSRRAQLEPSLAWVMERSITVNHRYPKRFGIPDVLP